MDRVVGKLAILGMTIALLCLVGGDALAKDPTRPYRARSAGMVTAAALECDGWGDLVEETGNATHLGRYEATACVFVAGIPDPPTLVPNAGYGVVTAANGDLLYISFTGTTDVSGAIWVLNFKITIDGGTGRFANAAGQFDYVATRPAAAPPYTASALGTIAY